MTSRGRRRVIRGTLALAGLALLSGCDAARWPRQHAKVTRIGFLAAGSRQGRQMMVDGLLEGLREHGYEEGRNIAIEYRFSDDRDDRLPALAAELVALPVDLIVASGAPASVAARDATRAIPIVMGGLAADPIEAGFVASLSRPGGNITGMSLMTAQLGGKRLELLKQMIPPLSRVGIFWNPPNPTYGPVLREFEAAALGMGLELVRLEVRVPEDFESAFAAATQHRAGALIATGDPLTTNRIQVLASLALQHRMPMLMESRAFTEAGGLLAHGADRTDSFRRAATYVDKILKGAHPGELPMQLPGKFDLVVNMRTAQELGLTIPPVILHQAEVIQ